MKGVVLFNIKKLLNNNLSEISNIILPVEKDVNNFILIKSFYDQLTNIVIKNKILNTITKILPPIITAGIFIKKNFYDKSINSDLIYRKLLNMPQSNDICLYDISGMIDINILKWLCTTPEMDDIKIINFVGYNSLTNKDYKLDSVTLTNVKDSEYSNIMILIKYNSGMICVDVPLSNLITNINLIDIKIWCNNVMFDTCLELITIFQNKYIAGLNFDENVLIFNDDTLSVRKRCDEFNYNIQQFEIDEFVNKIDGALTKRIKYACTLVGKPGTGKSLILKCIESKMKNYPIIYLTPTNFKNPDTIDKTFSFIQRLDSSIIIIEDFDSYGLDKKNKDLCVLLNMIDNMKVKSNMVLIFTINNSSGLDDTIINRRGRNDEVIEILPPTNKNEIYTVMQNHYTAETSKKFINISKINNKIFKRLLKYKFTQSDICSIINSILIADGKFTTKNFDDCINSILKTIKTIKNYRK